MIHLIITVNLFQNLQEFRRSLNFLIKSAKKSSEYEQGNQKSNVGNIDKKSCKRRATAIC